METILKLPSESKATRRLQRFSIVKALKEGHLSQTEIGQKFGVSTRTLRNYQTAIDAGKDPLVDNRHENSGRPSQVTDEAVTFALSFISHHPRATLTSICREMTRRAAEFRGAIPTPRQLGYVLNGNHAEVVNSLRQGRGEYHAENAIVVRRAYSPINSLWQLDATQMDVYALDTRDGFTLFRPWLVGIIEATTRSILAACVVEKAPTSTDILFTLRTAMLPKGDPLHFAYGIAESVSPDNQSIMVSADVADGLYRLGIALDPTGVECPMQNGRQERWFGTITQDLFATLHGYTAQHEGLKKAKRNAIPFPVIQRIVNRWVGEYHSRDHSALGRSPFEAWFEGLETARGLAVDRAQVRSALKVRETVRVQRDGIALPDGRHLNAKFLVHFVGKDINLRWPLVPGESSVEAYDGGQYLGILKPIEGDEKLGTQISQERLRSAKDIEALKSRLLTNLKRVPAVLTEAVVPEKPSKSGKAKGKPAKSHRKIEVPNLGSETRS